MNGKREMSSLILLMVWFMFVGSWEVFPMAMAAGSTSPSQCKQERKLLENACKAVIYGANPSAECCQRVRVTQLECVCPYVTPKLAALIPVQRTVNQIQACGRPVPHKFKCGSITTP